MTKALIIGEIARRLNWPVHCVDYLIRSRDMEAEARAGNRDGLNIDLGLLMEGRRA